VLNRHLGHPAGKVKVSEEVINELEKKDDGAADWIKARPGMIVAGLSASGLSVREE